MGGLTVVFKPRYCFDHLARFGAYTRTECDIIRESATLCTAR